MMSARRKVLIGDVAEFQEGYVNPKQGISEYFSGPIKWLRAVDLNDGLVFETSRTLSEKGFNSAGKSAILFEPNTLAISKSGTIGRLGILKDRMCGNRAVINIKPKHDVVDLRYLFYALHAYRDEIINRAEGSVQKNLYVSALSSIEIELPDIGEQRRISAVVGPIDDKIELNRRMSATLEEMARALYRSWFVDFDPVHARALGQSPAHMDATTAALFPDSFGPDGLPKGWERKRLGDLLVLNYGKALKKSLREPGPYPVYGSGGTDTTHTLALVSEPTIIVGRKGTVGSVMWEPNGCWPIDTTFYVTSDLSMSFILRTLQALPLVDMNTDAAVPGLNRENAYRLEVPLPQETVVSAFDGMAATWQAKIDQAATENRNLATLRDTLLPRLMSGELRIREAEKQVEEVA